MSLPCGRQRQQVIGRLRQHRVGLGQRTSREISREAEEGDVIAGIQIQRLQLPIRHQRHGDELTGLRRVSQLVRGHRPVEEQIRGLARGQRLRRSGSAAGPHARDRDRLRCRLLVLKAARAVVEDGEQGREGDHAEPKGT